MLLASNGKDWNHKYEIYLLKMYIDNQMEWKSWHNALHWNPTDLNRLTYLFANIHEQISHEYVRCEWCVDVKERRCFWFGSTLFIRGKANGKSFIGALKLINNLNDGDRLIAVYCLSLNSVALLMNECTFAHGFNGLQFWWVKLQSLDGIVLWVHIPLFVCF